MSAPPNVGPNPRRRESFSNAYKPFETAAGGQLPDGRPRVVSNVVVEDAIADEDDEAGNLMTTLSVSPTDASGPPRAFVRGMRSFSASYSQNAKPAFGAHVGPGPAKAQDDLSRQQQPAQRGGPGGTHMAKSPAEGGWWFGDVKEF